MRRGKFCPKCGKKVDELHVGLCEECYKEGMSPPEDLSDRLVVGTCKMCGNIFLGERKFGTVEQAVEKFLGEILEEREVQSATYRISGGSLLVTVKMKSDNVEKEVEKKMELVTKAITCKFCNLKKSSFYNATIQIRAPKDDLEKFLSEVERKMDEIRKHDNYAFVSETQKVRGGVDLLVGSKNAADTVGTYMKNKHGAEIKFSKKLSGLIEGKKVYRDTILINLNK